MQYNSRVKAEPFVAVHECHLRHPNHYASGCYESYLEVWRELSNPLQGQTRGVPWGQLKLLYWLAEFVHQSVWIHKRKKYTIRTEYY